MQNPPASTIKIGNSEYEVIPTMRLAAKVERALKKPILKFVKELEEFNVYIDEIVDFIETLLSDCEQKPSRDAIYDAVGDKGMAPYIATLAEVCATFFVGNSDVFDTPEAAEAAEGNTETSL